MAQLRDRFVLHPDEPDACRPRQCHVLVALYGNVRPGQFHWLRTIACCRSQSGFAIPGAPALLGPACQPKPFGCPGVDRRKADRVQWIQRSQRCVPYRLSGGPAILPESDRPLVVLRFAIGVFRACAQSFVLCAQHHHQYGRNLPGWC